MRYLSCQMKVCKCPSAELTIALKWTATTSETSVEFVIGVGKSYWKRSLKPANTEKYLLKVT